MGTGPLLASKPYSYKVHAIDLASQELRSQRHGSGFESSTLRLSTVFSYVRCSHGSLTVFNESFLNLKPTKGWV